jgi:hypothetical protein
VSILNISIKLIAVKIASTLSVKKVTTQFHCLKMICITLLINVCSIESNATPLFNVESQGKPLFDVSFKNNNSSINNDLGVMVMEKNDNEVAYYKQINEASKQEGSSAITEKRALVYVNGMNTPLRKAVSNLMAVENTVATEVPRDNVQLAYNINEYWTNELAEVAAQHIRQEGDLTERQSWVKIAYDFIQPDIYNNVFNKLKIIETILSDLDEDNYVNDADLNKHINSIYLPLLDDKYEVVILGHSQGNFYANRAWDAISQMPNGENLTSSLGLVGIASPANHISGSASGTELYTTSHNDKVIRTIRNLSAISPLLSNINIPETSIFDLGHALEEDYLKNHVSRKKIVDDVSEMFDRIVPALDTSCTGFNTNNTNDWSGTIEPGENYIGQISMTFDADSAPDTLYLATFSGTPIVNWVTQVGPSTITINYDGPNFGGLYYNVVVEGGSNWSLRITCLDNI